MCDLEALAQGGHSDCTPLPDRAPGIHLDLASLWGSLSHPGLTWDEPTSWLASLFWALAAVAVLWLAARVLRGRPRRQQQQTSQEVEG